MLFFFFLGWKELKIKERKRVWYSIAQKEKKTVFKYGGRELNIKTDVYIHMYTITNRCGGHRPPKWSFGSPPSRHGFFFGLWLREKKNQKVILLFFDIPDIEKYYLVARTRTQVRHFIALFPQKYTHTRIQTLVRTHARTHTYILYT